MCANVIQLYLSGSMSDSEFADTCSCFRDLYHGIQNYTPRELCHVTENSTSTPKENVRIAVCSGCNRCMVTCRVFCPFCIVLKKQVVYLFKGCNQPKCLANTSNPNSIITSLDGNESKCLNAFCYHVRRNSATDEYYYNHVISIIGDLMATGQFDAIRNTTRSEILETLKRCKEGNLISTLNCQNTISLFAHLGEEELAMAAADCCRDTLLPGDDTTLFEKGLSKAISKNAPEKLLFAEKEPASKDVTVVRKENRVYRRKNGERVNAVDAILAKVAAQNYVMADNESEQSDTDEGENEVQPDENEGTQLPQIIEEEDHEVQPNNQVNTEHMEQQDDQGDASTQSDMGKSKGDGKTAGMIL